MNSKNLILITLDQCRGDWLNPYNPVCRFPTVEKIARKGTIATNCYTNSPQCVPARLSWLTGLEPSQIGVTKNEAVNINDKTPSIFKKLQREGWHIEIVGKTHWTNHRESCDLRDNISLFKKKGFANIIEVAGPRALGRVECDLTDLWKQEGFLKKQMEDIKRRYSNKESGSQLKVEQTILPIHLYTDVWITERAIERLKQIPQDQPWVLWVSFVGPHEPFDTPAQWKGMSNKLKCTHETELPDSWLRKIPEECQLAQSYRRWQKQGRNANIEEIRHDYADKLYMLDELIGNICKSAEGREDYAETAIAITADHGELLGDCGMFYKSNFLDGAVKVPFIFKDASSCPAQFRKRKIVKDTIQSNRLLKKIVRLMLKDKLSANNLFKVKEDKSIAVSEYGDEVMICQGPRKMVFNRHSGKILWCTRRKVQYSLRSLRKKFIEVGCEAKEYRRWSELNELRKKTVEERKVTGWRREGMVN